MTSPASELTALPTFETPRLDAMSRAELGAFIEMAEQARNLWGSRRGGVRATAMLCDYALLRASALTYREARDFQHAAHEESECARLLAELPRWARW